MACISLSWIIRFSDESVNIVEILFESSYNRIYIFSKESGKNFGSHAKSVWFELKIKKKERKRRGRKGGGKRWRSAAFISTNHQPLA